MKNITISLEDALAKWVRIFAAQHELSISKMIANLLREKMLGGSSYEKAKNDFLKKPAKTLRSSVKQAYPKRSELYE